MELKREDPDEIKSKAQLLIVPYGIETIFYLIQ